MMAQPSCESLHQGLLESWLDGFLDESTARQVEQHVNTCSSCTAMKNALHEEALLIQDALKSTGKARVMADTSTARSVVTRAHAFSPQRRSGVALWLSLAAMLVAGLFVYTQLRHSGEENLEPAAFHSETPRQLIATARPVATAPLIPVEEWKASFDNFGEEYPALQRVTDNAPWLVGTIADGKTLHSRDSVNLLEGDEWMAGTPRFGEGSGLYRPTPMPDQLARSTPAFGEETSVQGRLQLTPSP